MLPRAYLIKHYAKKACGGVDFYIQMFLTSALVGVELSASRPCRFTLRERTQPLDRRLDGPQSPSGRYREMRIFDATVTRTPTHRSSSP
jgi:hypothetical protein